MKKNDFINGLKLVLIEKGFEDNLDELFDKRYGMGVFDNNNWFVNSNDCLVDDIILDEVDMIISDYCRDNGIGFIV